MTCDFPGCTHPPRRHELTCVLHERVKVSGSWVPDRHDKGDDE
jgi:hypothetical protein